MLISLLSYWRERVCLDVCYAVVGVINGAGRVISFSGSSGVCVVIMSIGWGDAALGAVAKYDELETCGWVIF